MEDNRAWDVGASATAIGQEVIIYLNFLTNPSKDSPLLVRSGHRVEVELHSYTRSNQVDFHLSFILLYGSYTFAEIEVAGENENEKDSKEIETQVSKWPSADIVITLKVLV